MRTLTRSLLAGAVALGISFAAAAQNYPARPVRILSSIPQGGSGDVALRMASA